MNPVATKSPMREFTNQPHSTPESNVFHVTHLPTAVLAELQTLVVAVIAGITVGVIAGGRRGQFQIIGGFITSNPISYYLFCYVGYLFILVLLCFIGVEDYVFLGMIIGTIGFLLSFPLHAARQLSRLT